MNNFFWIHKIGIFIASFVVILVTLLLFIFLINIKQPPNGGVVLPTGVKKTSQATEQIISLQKTKIGITKEDEVVKLPGFIKKETLPGEQTRYSFESTLNARPNEIITDNHIVVYEKDLIPESPSTPGYTTISDIESRYGNPERIVNGSKFYGYFIDYYIYASLGFAFAGNKHTNEVYEFQFFKPMSIQEYLNFYGSDVSFTSSPPKE